MNPQVNTIGAIFIGVVTSGGLWTTLQFVLNWSGRRAEASRLKAAEEKDREDARKAEAERLTFIQQVERTAYDRAVQAADERVKDTEKRCLDCETEVQGLRLQLEQQKKLYEQRIRRLEDSNYALVDVALEIVPLLDADAEHTLALRNAIREARQARYRYGLSDSTPPDSSALDN